MAAAALRVTGNQLLVVHAHHRDDGNDCSHGRDQQSEITAQGSQCSLDGVRHGGDGVRHDREREREEQQRAGAEHVGDPTTRGGSEFRICVTGHGTPSAVDDGTADHYPSGLNSG